MAPPCTRDAPDSGGRVALSLQADDTQAAAQARTIDTAHRVPFAEVTV